MIGSKTLTYFYSFKIRSELKDGKGTREIWYHFSLWLDEESYQRQAQEACGRKSTSKRLNSRASTFEKGLRKNVVALSTLQDRICRRTSVTNSPSPPPYSLDRRSQAHAQPFLDLYHNRSLAESWKRKNSV